MYFLCKCVAAFSLITVGLLALAEPKPLRVCADSNNLPFSNDQRQGFENKLAAMVARDLGRRLQYIWWPQSPGRAERMFRQGACDLVLEVPTKAAGPNATRSYYSSGYVFVTQKTVASPSAPSTIQFCARCESDCRSSAMTAATSLRSRS
jgi:mxaJ protein